MNSKEMYFEKNDVVITHNFTRICHSMEHYPMGWSIQSISQNCTGYKNGCSYYVQEEDYLFRENGSIHEFVEDPTHYYIFNSRIIKQ